MAERASLFHAPGSYEYGVLYEQGPNEPHRSGMTYEEALIWLAEWVDMGGQASAVSLIRRWQEPWERA